MTSVHWYGRLNESLMRNIPTMPWRVAVLTNARREPKIQWQERNRNKKRDIFFLFSISFFRAEREKLFESGGGMEPDRSKQQQQQHTTARHRKLLLSNRMNENLCVCVTCWTIFYISSFERNPFLFYITPEGFFFLFKTFLLFFFYRFMAALVCFISMAIWCEHCAKSPSWWTWVLGCQPAAAIILCTLCSQEALLLPLPPFYQ